MTHTEIEPAANVSKGDTAENKMDVKSLSTVRGFAIGNNQTGIVLAVGRSDGENSFHDKGFFYNIEEFNQILKSCCLILMKR